MLNSTVFNPTHLLISRTRQVPVQLIPTKEGMQLLTEPEWQQQAEPAFMMHPKRGFFCKGIQIIGYSLQPLNLQPLPVELVTAPSQASGLAQSAPSPTEAAIAAQASAGIAPLTESSPPGSIPVNAQTITKPSDNTKPSEKSLEMAKSLEIPKAKHPSSPATPKATKGTKATADTPVHA